MGDIAPAGSYAPNALSLTLSREMSLSPRAKQGELVIGCEATCPAGQSSPTHRLSCIFLFLRAPRNRTQSPAARRASSG